jgi:hypothetical protein
LLLTLRLLNLRLSLLLWLSNLRLSLLLTLRLLNLRLSLLLLHLLLMSLDLGPLLILPLPLLS